MTTTFEADRSAAARFFKAPIPVHDKPELHRLPARELATWPAGTFVENIHARVDGSLLVSVHSAGELHRWREGHGVDVFARLPTSPAAINAHPDGGVVVVGGSVGTGPQFVWHVDDGGAEREIARLPDALFFHGRRVSFPGTCSSPKRYSAGSITSNLPPVQAACGSPTTCSRRSRRK
jgi:hypothetical protein